MTAIEIIEAKIIELNWEHNTKVMNYHRDIQEKDIGKIKSILEFAKLEFAINILKELRDKIKEQE